MSWHKKVVKLSPKQRAAISLGSGFWSCKTRNSVGIERVPDIIENGDLNRSKCELFGPGTSR